MIKPQHLKNFMDFMRLKPRMILPIILPLMGPLMGPVIGGLVVWLWAFGAHAFPDFETPIQRRPPPLPPQSLSIHGPPQGDLIAEWRPSEGADSYNLYLTSKKDSPLDIPTYRVKAPTHSQSLTGLEGPLSLFLRIVAIDGSGQESAPSQPFLLEVPDPAPLPPRLPKGRPNVVTPALKSVTMSEVGEFSFRLTWNPTPESWLYEIYVESNNRFEAPLPSYRTRETTQVIKGLESSSSYFIKIVAIGSNGKNLASKILRVQTLGPSSISSSNSLSGSPSILPSGSSSTKSDFRQTQIHPSFGRGMMNVALNSKIQGHCEDPHRHREGEDCLPNRRSCAEQPNNSTGGFQDWEGDHWGNCKNFQCQYGFFQEAHGHCVRGCKAQRISWFHTKAFSLQPPFYCAGEAPALRENQEFDVPASIDSAKGILGRGHLRVKCHNSELVWKDPNFSSEEWTQYLLNVRLSKPLSMSCANEFLPFSKPTLTAHCSSLQTADQCQTNPMDRKTLVQSCRPLFIQLKDLGFDQRLKGNKKLNQILNTQYRVEIQTSQDHFSKKYDVTPWLRSGYGKLPNARENSSASSLNHYGFKIWATKALENHQINIIFTSSTPSKQNSVQSHSAEIKISVTENHECHSESVEIAAPANIIIGGNKSEKDFVRRGSPEIKTHSL